MLEQAHALAAELRAAGIRVKLDDRVHVRPGAKFFEWELKGAPIRVELGERELARGEVSVARRDREPRELVSLDRLAERLQAMLGEIHQELFDRAAAHLADTHPELRRSRRADRVPEGGQRLCCHRLVRLAGVRGSDQGGDVGDPPLPRARARGSGRALPRLRPARR